MVDCRIELIVSSILAIACRVAFSISRRVVKEVLARGMRSVETQDCIKCMMAMAERRLPRYVRSGSRFVDSAVDGGI